MKQATIDRYESIIAMEEKVGSSTSGRGVRMSGNARELRERQVKALAEELEGASTADLHAAINQAIEFLESGSFIENEQFASTYRNILAAKRVLATRPYAGSAQVL